MSPLFLGVIIETDEDSEESNDSEHALLEEEAAITETKIVFTRDEAAKLGGLTFFEEDADDEAEADEDDEADESETVFGANDEDLLLNRGNRGLDYVKQQQNELDVWNSNAPMKGGTDVGKGPSVGNDGS